MNDEPKDNVVSIASRLAVDPGEAMQRVRDDERNRRVNLMLLALVKRDGRVRITRAELEALERSGGGRLDVKVQVNGDLVVSFA